MHSHPKEADLQALLAKLCDAGVEFIVVGEMLAGHGQINLSTSLGPIDPLCELDAGQGYDELLPHSEPVSDEGRLLRVLDYQR